MNNEIIKLLKKLNENLIEIQKIDYTELKEKVEIINERYEDIKDNIILNLFDIRTAQSIICDIQTLIAKEEFSILGIEDTHRNMAFLIKHGFGGTIENDFEDSTPYDDDIKYQVDRLGTEINNLKNKRNATERAGNN